MPVARVTPAWARDEGERERKDGDIGAAHTLRTLAARRARAGFARKHHFQRNEKQQGAAEDAERIDADSRDAQERCTAEREQHEDETRHQHGLERHLVLITNTGTFGQAAEYRQQGQRFHDDEKDDKKFQELIEHDALREPFFSSFSS